MEKKSFIVILFALFSAVLSAQTVNKGERYAQNSVLNSGKWVKIAIKNSGIYKITYEDLVANGISNPANVRVFGYGGALLPETFTSPYIDDLPEIAIYMNKGADGVFNAGDYILFYAQGLISWTYGNPSGATTAMFYHTINHYANEGYYFLTCDAGVGKRILTKEPITETPNGDIVDFTHYDLHEKDSVNLAKSGRDFYGEEFNSLSPTRTYTFNTPNMLALSERMRVKIANKHGSSISFAISINNTSIGTMNIDGVGGGDYGVDKKSVYAFTVPSSNQATVKLTCTTANARANLDFIELNARRRLIADGNGKGFYFRNKTTQNQFKRFVVANVDENIQIWNITNRQNIVQISATHFSDTLTFVAKVDSIKEYLALNPLLKDSFPTPKFVGLVANQNLHALPQADYIIIANNDFMGEAERLAQAHRQREGYTIHIIDANKIYNEFSSGTPDATAYRRFVKMFYDRAYSSQNENVKFPKYLLLFGDGCFDNRKLLNNTSEPIHRLLTFQSVNSVSGTASYVSDDYFGYMDDNTGSMSSGHNLSVGVGRFPVYTLEQAKTLVDKTLYYMDNSIRGNWKNQVVFVADDGDSGDHEFQADSVARISARTNPNILVKKLYLDAYKKFTSAAGDRYPDVENLLENYINQGVLMINYLGHGSMNNWAGENILNKQKIDNMNNDKFPIYVTATCDFTGFDQFDESAGERLLWNKNGGTMALFTTTRTVYSAQNFELNKYFANNIFKQDDDCELLSLGDILILSKNLQKNTNKFAFTLVGDPALKLIYPHKAKVITDSINFNPINSLDFDTVSALGVVHLGGHIENCYGDEIQGFNGFITVSVFDKEEKIITLKNPGGNINFEYQDRPNPLFVGSAEVKNGKWKIAFVIPKDIKYNFGTGRIVYYASENNLGMEANGNFENFIIGGETANAPLDNLGPRANLYMNTPAFRNGGQVNISPLFVAEIFDENGINAIGSGIGHDIVMRVSGVDKNGNTIANYDNEEIILNNYYSSKFGSYKEGKVEFPFYNLEEGNYHIKFRIWDVYNNSTNAELRFVVSKEGKIDVLNAYTYPNPAAVGETINFYLTHDHPNQPLSAKISVCDVTGHTLCSALRQATTTGATSEIQWNPSEDGCVLGQGLYIVRLELFTQTEKSYIIPIKLMIK